MHTANVKKYALLQDKSLYHLLKTLLLSPAVRLLQAECNKKYIYNYKEYSFQAHCAVGIEVTIKHWVERESLRVTYIGMLRKKKQ